MDGKEHINGYIMCFKIKPYSSFAMANHRSTSMLIQFTFRFSIFSVAFSELHSFLINFLITTKKKKLLKH